MPTTKGSTGSSNDGAGIERRLIPTSFGYLHCRVAGTGRDIVMLHANVRSSAMFVTTMRALSPRLRSCAIDLPGFGDSDHPDTPLTMAEFVEAVRETIVGLGLDRPVVLGHALGATLAVELAITNPGVVSALVLQSCPFYRSPEFARERHSIALAAYRTDSTGFPLIRQMDEVYERSMGHAPRVPTQEWLDMENIDMVKAGRGFWDVMPVVAAYSLDGRIDRVECPTLLLSGTEFLYPNNNDEFTKRMKNYRAVYIPNSGFFPQIDNPAEYQKAIADFVLGLP